MWTKPWSLIDEDSDVDSAASFRLSVNAVFALLHRFALGVLWGSSESTGLWPDVTELTNFMPLNNAYGGRDKGTRLSYPFFFY